MYGGDQVCVVTVETEDSRLRNILLEGESSVNVKVCEISVNCMVGAKGYTRERLFNFRNTICGHFLQGDFHTPLIMEISVLDDWICYCYNTGPTEEKGCSFANWR